MEERSPRDKPQGHQELVPDTGLVDPEAEEVRVPGEEVPAALRTLQPRLTEQGFATRLVHSGIPPKEYYFLEFDIPAGRSTRPVRVAPDAADGAESIDFSQWRSLERYDAIWSLTEGTIEAVIRGNRFGIPLPWIIARFRGEGRPPDRGGEVKEVVLRDQSGSISVRLGPATAPARIIFGGHPRSRPVTLSVHGLPVASAVSAERLLEAVADSLLFESELAFGTSVTLARLEPREVASVRTTRQRRDHHLQFPTNSYPHEPVMLFKAGVDRLAPATIRYWALYQVLEYFFPKYATEEVRRRLGRMLRDPRFDVHSDEDLAQAANLLMGSGRAQLGRELEQLTSTVQSIVDEDELRDFIVEAGLVETVADRRSEASSEVIALGPGDDVRKSASRRIYDIRCRIVHSKSDGRDSGGGLIPGSHHDDLIRAELPLIYFLAERALIASAERLDLRLASL